MIAHKALQFYSAKIVSLILMLISALGFILSLFAVMMSLGAIVSVVAGTNSISIEGTYLVVWAIGSLLSLGFCTSRAAKSFFSACWKTIGVVTVLLGLVLLTSPWIWMAGI